MRRAFTTLGLGFLALAAACEPIAAPNQQPASLDGQLRRSLQNWTVVPIGPQQPQDTALVTLGRALMFDKELSGNRDIACATCHVPALHATDGLSLAIGTGGSGTGPARTLGPGREFVPRNAPSLLNGGIGLFYVFWDGRINGSRGFSTPAGFALPPNLPNILAAQAMFPVTNRREMRGEPGDTDVFGRPNELAQFADTQYVAIWTAVMSRLLSIPGYVAMFRAAYPGRLGTDFRFEDAARAIAAFEIATMTRTGSPFDRYLEREDNALTVEAKRGGILFFGRAGCSSCHNGPFLGGNQFANTGVPQIGPGVGADAPLDKGRGAVINNDFYQFAFRVVPLRNVELTAPYFHDGAFPTLEAVVEHYDDVATSLRNFDPSHLTPPVRALYHGDNATINAVMATLDFRVRQPLNLSDAERSDLVAFLKSLTDPGARDLTSLTPPTVPSGLPVQ